MGSNIFYQIDEENFNSNKIINYYYYYLKKTQLITLLGIAQNSTLSLWSFFKFMYKNANLKRGALILPPNKIWWVFIYEPTNKLYKIQT